MSNKRMISGDLFEDNICSEDFFTRLLWIGIIAAVADDQGRLIDNPAIMRARIFLYDKNVTDEMIQESLDKLGNSICRYEAEGKRLIQIVNWWKYQTPSWAAASRFPSPEGWVDRVKVHTGNKDIRIENWDKKGGWVRDFVHSPLPKGTHSKPDSALNEYEVKCENEYECKGSDAHISPIQALLEKHTGITPSTANDLKALDEITAIDPIEEDIKAAINWLDGQGITAIYSYHTLVQPIRIEKSNRLKKSKTAQIADKNKAVFKKVLEEEGARVN